MTSDLELVRGTFDLILLKTLSWGPMHGFGVLRWIEQTTGQRLQIEEGALYPALHRLEQKKWLSAEWGLSENNRKAKYYKLTALGRRQLVQEVSRWTRFVEAVDMVLDAKGAL
ncbi:MAG: PadR family transcriptional regulator [Gemmatimonadaceae bacterium]|nr:PadR family transcriptional regulator [Gemmatimonadaceae bacterium]MBX9855592.1 PadR family transcriptional regulator [Gemmatimonadaceae bacterium]